MSGDSTMGVLPGQTWQHEATGGMYRVDAVIGGVVYLVSRDGRECAIGEMSLVRFYTKRSDS